MNVVGIDIGTTSISILSMDAETGEVTAVKTATNNAWTDKELRLQDPDGIYAEVKALLEPLLAEHETAGIGITGQMHGILYVDGDGAAVSPLYTWQNSHGDEKESGGVSYATALSRVTGYSPLATGYGAVTHYYLAKNGQAHVAAKALCTIGDYVAMKLCGREKPLLHASNAHSMGVFDLARGDFDRHKLNAAGLDPNLFPAVVSSPEVVGHTGGGIPVSAAIGDNQASFLGSVRDADSILINVGTGGQISIASPLVEVPPGLVELRPLMERESCLLVGSSLCAGSAYALLYDFFRQVLESAGIPAKESEIYGWMNRLAAQSMDTEPSLEVSTLLLGTRTQPELRGGITGIGLDNFTPLQMVAGFLEGIVAEFQSLLGEMPLPPGQEFRQMVCSGNGIRKNPALQQMLARRFGLPLVFPAHREEACYGAALTAAVASGAVKSMERARRLIRYEALGLCESDENPA